MDHLLVKNIFKNSFVNFTKTKSCLKTEKEKKKDFSEIDMIDLKFNRAKNEILLNQFPPVDLFKLLRAHILKRG
jgi:beta-xylosidase